MHKSLICALREQMLFLSIWAISTHFTYVSNLMAQSNTQNDMTAGIKDALNTSIHDSNTQENISTYDLTLMKAKVSKTLKFLGDHKKVNSPAEVELANIMALVDKNYRKLISETVTFAKRYAQEMQRTLEEIDKANQNHKTNFNNQSVKFLISSRNLESKSRSLTTEARALENSKVFALGVGTATAAAVGMGGGALILGGGVVFYHYLLGWCTEKAGGKYYFIYVAYNFSGSVKARFDALKYRELFDVANESSVSLNEIDETLKQLQIFWSPVPINRWRELDDDYRKYVNAFSHLEEHSR
ncbi:hypothetical protein BC936DRAFT_138808 [Jimgerdemannia flammicorona]|uniref:Uncharacterized protein n=1 Tax=Jimgerdemannia flammicorona TaxID=994334 RepID=A0A433BHP0_9FUNG|nr:hypothetical protein BC936DRAFT_138808 [Jimgerdemannia flammicorona]